MAEVAGLVLGGIPLIMYALDNYKRCLDQGKDYWRYSSTLSTIRSHLFVQQEQLDVTLRNLGIVKPSRADLEQHLHLLYSKSKCSEFLAIIDNMEHITSRIMNNLDIDSRGKPRWSAESQERIHWEWRRVRRSFGRKERDQLIAELQYWNTALKNIFEKVEIPTESSDPLLEEIQARFNKKHCDTIRKNIQIMHGLLSQRWHCSCKEHQGNIQLDWPESKIATVDKFTLLISSNCAHEWHTTSIHFEAEESDDEDHATSVSDSAVLRPSSPSRLEKWKDALRLPSSKKHPSVQCLAVPAPTPPNGPRTPTIPEISCICSHFKTCTCHASGYIPCADDDRTRLVFSRSSRASTPTRCVTLQSLLVSPKSSRHPSGHLSLSRKHRLSIAAAATWATLYLCGSPWMGEDWKGKEQIQLFIETAGTPESIAEFPTLGYLFKSAQQYSTPDSHTPSADLDEFQRTQIRNKCLFTLGVLLIELCLNKPFEKLRQDHQRDNVSSPSLGLSTSVVSDYDIANRLIEDIYLDAGDPYGYAVQRCLRCEFPGQDSRKTFDFHQFRQDFFQGVVAPVQATYMKQPGSVAAL